MSLVCCNVALSEGKWQTKPTLAAVNNILDFYFGNNLEWMEVAEPDPDVMLQVEVAAHTGLGYGHEEAVRDRIVLALLRRFKPEYESQVEIEIVDEWEDVEDDGWDGSHFHEIERIWI